MSTGGLNPKLFMLMNHVFAVGCFLFPSTYRICLWITLPGNLNFFNLFYPHIWCFVRADFDRMQLITLVPSYCWDRLWKNSAHLWPTIQLFIQEKLIEVCSYIILTHERSHLDVNMTGEIRAIRMDWFDEHKWAIIQIAENRLLYAKHSYGFCI